MSEPPLTPYRRLHEDALSSPFPAESSSHGISDTETGGNAEQPLAAHTAFKLRASNAIATPGTVSLAIHISSPTLAPDEPVNIWCWTDVNRSRSDIEYMKYMIDGAVEIDVPAGATIDVLVAAGTHVAMLRDIETYERDTLSVPCRLQEGVVLALTREGGLSAGLYSVEWEGRWLLDVPSSDNTSEVVVPAGELIITKARQHVGFVRGEAGLRYPLREVNGVLIPE